MSMDTKKVLEDALKVPGFKMPDSYEYFAKLMGMLGKPFGMLGAPYGEMGHALKMYRTLPPGMKR